MATFLTVDLRHAARLLGRALLRRCPNCGGGGIFAGWFHMRAACPTCAIPFERGESPPWDLLQSGGGVLMVLAPILFYPFSTTLFLAFDLIFRPVGHEAAGGSR